MNKNITQLTSAEAVEAAIAECDELGRDVFLKRYGYKRATKYAIVVNGREYDSKLSPVSRLKSSMGYPWHGTPFRAA
jgi:hypothetical protein